VGADMVAGEVVDLAMKPCEARYRNEIPAVSITFLQRETPSSISPM